jgi:hypothetical protein
MREIYREKKEREKRKGREERGEQVSRRKSWP